MWKKFVILLEMIKFEHTVFAMPFALTGAFLAQRGVPGLATFFWVIMAMVGARTSAMGFNRIVDRHIDAANPRTAKRALPAGEVRLFESWLMVILSAALFFLACYMLNHLALVLSPFALALTWFYSITKRFTSFCHLVLGMALAVSPMGGWIAVNGNVSGYPWVLSLAVILWVSGFDSLYACQDTEFDRKAGLCSMPAKLGHRTTFRIALSFHILAFALFALTGIWTQLNGWYYLGLVISAFALFYQHLIVNPRDLSRINQAFFSMNGIVSLTLFFATWLSLATGT